MDKGKRFAEDFDRIDVVRPNDRILIQDSVDGIVKFANPSQLGSGGGGGGVPSDAVLTTPQELTEAQREQAFENLGVKTVFIDYATEIGVVLSEERFAKIIGASQIVIETPEIGKVVLPRTYFDDYYCYFEQIYKNTHVYRITAQKIQRAIAPYIHKLSDTYAVKYSGNQNLSESSKANARTNIGAQKELSVETKPNGDIAIQGIGNAPVYLVPADRLAPYVLTLTASEDAPGGYTLEGTADELEATAQSIVSNPHARVYIDCSVVTGVSTPIPAAIVKADAASGVVHLEADPYIYDGMIQAGGTPALDCSVLVSIGPELLQVSVRKNIADEIKKRLFVDLWNSACGPFGTYNSQTGYFELNGLTDITYAQAIAIYTKWANSNYIRQQYQNADIRTNIPQPLVDVVQAESAFYNCKAEVINLSSINAGIRGIVTNIFRSCFNLERVISEIWYNSKNDLFYTGSKLRDIEIINSGYDMKLVTPVLSLHSLVFLIEHRNNINTSNTITVTVHADVYAKLTGDTTNAATAALTPEELAQWTALVEAAAEKNITFAMV